MNISDLPEKYNKLAKERRDASNGTTDSDYLSDAFDWPSTPEGAYFWIQCHNADDESELPPLSEDE